MDLSAGRRLPGPHSIRKRRVMAGYVYRGSQRVEPEPPTVITPQCGTEAGSSRHRRRGEPVDEACRQAAANADKARRAAKKAMA
jgi:hypothetical protein